MEEEATKVVANEAALRLAASWLPSIEVDLDGITATLLGGHTSESSNLYVQCHCPLCEARPPTAGLNTLEEQVEHVTGEELPESQDQCDAVCRTVLRIRGPDNRMMSLSAFMRQRAEALGGAQLVGRSLWMHWPDDAEGAKALGLGTWYPATIISFSPRTGEHLLQYQEDGIQLRVFLAVAPCHFGSQPPAPSTLPNRDPAAADNAHVIAATVLAPAAAGATAADAAPKQRSDQGQQGPMIKRPAVFADAGAGAADQAKRQRQELAAATTPAAAAAAGAGVQLQQHPGQAGALKLDSAVLAAAGGSDQPSPHAFGEPSLGANGRGELLAALVSQQQAGQEVGIAPSAPASEALYKLQQAQVAAAAPPRQRTPAPPPVQVPAPVVDAKTSRFRGVSWNKRTLKWQVTLYARGRYRYFGSYTDQDEAARAYDRAALVWKGPSAVLNFPASDYTKPSATLAAATAPAPAEGGAAAADGQEGGGSAAGSAQPSPGGTVRSPGGTAQPPLLGPLAAAMAAEEAADSEGDDDDGSDDDGGDQDMAGDLASPAGDGYGPAGAGGRRRRRKKAASKLFTRKKIHKGDGAGAPLPTPPGGRRRGRPPKPRPPPEELEALMIQAAEAAVAAQDGAPLPTELPGIGPDGEPILPSMRAAMAAQAARESSMGGEADSAAAGSGGVESDGAMAGDGADGSGRRSSRRAAAKGARNIAAAMASVVNARRDGLWARLMQRAGDGEEGEEGAEQMEVEGAEYEGEPEGLLVEEEQQYSDDRSARGRPRMRGRGRGRGVARRVSSRYDYDDGDMEVDGAEGVQLDEGGEEEESAAALLLGLGGGTPTGKHEAVSEPAPRRRGRPPLNGGGRGRGRPSGGTVRPAAPRGRPRRTRTPAGSVPSASEYARRQAAVNGGYDGSDEEGAGGMYPNPWGLTPQQQQAMYAQQQMAMAAAMYGGVQLPPGILPQGAALSPSALAAPGLMGAWAGAMPNAGMDGGMTLAAYQGQYQMMLANMHRQMAAQHHWVTEDADDDDDDNSDDDDDDAKATLPTLPKEQQQQQQLSAKDDGKEDGGRDQQRPAAAKQLPQGQAQQQQQKQQEVGAKPGAAVQQQQQQQAQQAPQQQAAQASRAQPTSMTALLCADDQQLSDQLAKPQHAQQPQLLPQQNGQFPVPVPASAPPPKLPAAAVGLPRYGAAPLPYGAFSSPLMMPQGMPLSRPMGLPLGVPLAQQPALHMHAGGAFSMPFSAPLAAAAAMIAPASGSSLFPAPGVPVVPGMAVAPGDDRSRGIAAGRPPLAPGHSAALSAKAVDVAGVPHMEAVAGPNTPQPLATGPIPALAHAGYNPSAVVPAIMGAPQPVVMPGANGMQAGVSGGVVVPGFPASGAPGMLAVPGSTMMH